MTTTQPTTQPRTNGNGQRSSANSHAPASNTSGASAPANGANGKTYYPAAPQAEAGVIGSVLITDSAWPDVAMLESQDFTDARYRALFESMRDIVGAGGTIDILTVTARAVEARRLAERDAYDVAQACLYATPTAVNSRAYAVQVRDTAELRRIWFGMQRAAGQISHGATLAETLRTMQALTDATRTGASIVTASQAAHRVQDRIDAWQSTPGVSGIPSGFIDLDRLTGGFQPGWLTVLFGHAGEGKTTLAMQCVLHAAKARNGGHRALVCSMEMEPEALILRAASAIAGIEARRARTHQGLDEEEREKLTAALVELSELDLHFTEGAAMSTAEIRAEVARVRPAQVIVDHFGQLSDRRERGEQEGEYADRVLYALKAIAREARCHMVTVGHSNKAALGRADKRPQLQDFSQAKLKAPDLVAALYREEMHDSGTERKNMADVLVLKHRDGPTGDIELFFDGAHSRYFNAVRPEYDPSY